MMPRIQTRFGGWETLITLMKVTQMVDDITGEIVNIKTPIVFNGVVQPLGNKELMTKPTEQRSWQWLQIHTKSEQALDNNDVISYLGKNYQIRAQNSYNDYGYYEYHLVEQYG